MYQQLRVSNGLGRLARRSKAHGPAWGGPLSPLIGQRAGRAEPLVNLRPVAQPVGPQAGRAGLGEYWVKIKILLSFEGKEIRIPFPYGTISIQGELAIN